MATAAVVTDVEYELGVCVLVTCGLWTWGRPAEQLMLGSSVLGPAPVWQYVYFNTLSSSMSTRI